MRWGVSWSARAARGKFAVFTNEGVLNFSISCIIHPIFVYRSAGCVLTHPDAIKEAHKQYFEAGADIATTSTYQATVQGYMQRENDDITQNQAEDLIRKGVTLAIEARDEFWAPTGGVADEMKKKDSKRQRPLVAASLGCYGAAQADGSEYRGQYGLTIEEVSVSRRVASRNTTYSSNLRHFLIYPPFLILNEQKLMDWHRPRLALLDTTDADFLAFETIPCESELLAILYLLHEGEDQRKDTHAKSSSSRSRSRKPCWITMACQNGTRLNSGESLEACARHVLALDGSSTSRVVAFGVNCMPPQHVEEALSVIRRTFTSEAAGKEVPLLVAYPNLGEIWEDKQWLPGTGSCPTPEGFALSAARWVEAGASIVGGCCRTTPKTIQAVRARLIPVEEEEKQGVNDKRKQT